jgi:hypothetical protein
VVSIRHGRRLALLAVVAAGIAAWTLAAPASALTVTVPTLSPSAPLPALPLPTGASVSGGTGGQPIDISLTGPGATGVDLQLPGVPALPTGPTGSITAPVESPAAPVITPAPAWSAPTASSRGGDSNPAIGVPDDQTGRATPDSPFAAGAAQPAGSADGAPHSHVYGSINARPADSILSPIPSIASRVALWVALAAVVFVLQMLVGSAVSQHRRKSVPFS